MYAGFYDVYLREVEAFLKAIREKTPPPITLEDGRSAVEVVLAAYHAQAESSDRRNFVNRPKSYRSEAACHPLLA